MNIKLAELCAALIARSNLGAENISPTHATTLFKNFMQDPPKVHMNVQSIVVTVFADLIEGENVDLFLEETKDWIPEFEPITLQEAAETYPTLQSYLGEMI